MWTEYRRRNLSNDRAGIASRGPGSSERYPYLKRLSSRFSYVGFLLPTITGSGDMFPETESACQAYQSGYIAREIRQDNLRSGAETTRRQRLE